MCKGKGMIAIRGRQECVFCRDSNDHEPIIKKYRLRDKKLYLRNFVRLEVLPLASLTSTDVADWDVQVDEHGTLPGWFEDEKELWLDRARKQMVRSVVPDWVKNGVRGDLDLSCTKVTSLGKLTHVGGELDLSYIPITSLGELTYVGGNLYITNTNITDTSGVQVKGQICR